MPFPPEELDREESNIKTHGNSQQDIDKRGQLSLAKLFEYGKFILHINAFVVILSAALIVAVVSRSLIYPELARSATVINVRMFSLLIYNTF